MLPKRRTVGQTLTTQSRRHIKRIIYKNTFTSVNKIDDQRNNYQKKEVQSERLGRCSVKFSLKHIYAEKISYKFI